MTVASKHRFIQAALGQPVDKTPIWVMRQAGRYLPEYRKTRQHAGDFLTLCKTPELACKVTLQPLERFELDAAILFSDILTIPDAMGLDLFFTEGEGPKFKNIIQNEHDIKQLAAIDPEVELKYVMDAIRLIKSTLNDRVPLIGFSGSPWTLATYMVEGGSSKTFQTIKTMMYNQPTLLTLLLDKITTTVVDYLNAQINAGVDAIMIFDTWGGILAHREYELFSLHYISSIVRQLKVKTNNHKIPVIVFTKGGGLWLEKIANCGCDVVGLDWTINISDAKKRIGNQVSLQGNLDPCVLYASTEKIRTEVKKILADFGAGNGHIFNLGHGIHPDVNPDHMKALIDAVHSESVFYHQV